MIKAIIFDWGGVLIEEPTVRMREYCAKKLGIEVSKLNNLIDPRMSAYQAGLIDEMQMWKEISETLEIVTPSKPIWRDAVEVGFVDQKQVHDLAKELRDKKYIVAVLSNTEIAAMECFFANGYDKNFDFTIFSCAKNHVKPNKEIYDITINTIGLLPEEMVFIDDKVSHITGAKSMGIKGILFKNI